MSALTRPGFDMADASTRLAATRPPEAGIAGPEAVERRRMPYPYRAAIAICSDLDETPNAGTYLNTMRLLNETGSTAFGPGLGLEVGGTIYFDMPADQFSYWNTNDAGRTSVCALIKSGHVDCLHSFGDLATTRAHAARALDDLARRDCQLEVWIDHAVAPSNFGPDIMEGSGDVPGSPVFHADLTCAFGIEYVWLGRVTSVTGQGIPRDLRGIARLDHPVASGVTLAKEYCKGILGRIGSPKYAMHATNDVLRCVSLRSGHKVYEFFRSNPHWGGVSCGDTAEGVPEIVTSAMVERLIDREGVCVLYTHLGKMAEPQRGLRTDVVAALDALGQQHRGGKLLVTTTRRLLGYCRAAQEATWTATEQHGCLHVDISTRRPAGVIPMRDLEGFTFYVRDPARTRVTIDGVESNDVDCNPPDHTGRSSVSLRRRRLDFPRL